MIGQRFNRLVVLERVSKVGEKSIKYRCVCDCGNETIARKDHLINGAKTSCGCALYRAKENAEEFKAKYPQYIFLDEPDSYSKPIRVKCKKCGGIRETSRHQLQNGNQCPICCNQVICDGVNDIKTVAPWMLEYFVNESDVKRYSVKSDRKVQMKCPICGAEKYMVISKLYNRGFSCNCCGRNTSYPNRYIRAVLRQLPVENLTFEYSPNWIESKIFYDNYFTYKDKQYFVEADGIQHYSSRNNWNRNGEVNKKDELKDNLAKEHGIQMIRIDCQESSASYIKNTVRESQLADVFDLSIIDWEQCAKEAASNNIRDIAEYFNKVTQKPKQVAEHFKISKKVVYRKLREATECGLCKYEGRKNVGLYVNDNGQLKICAGRGKAEYGASTVRQGIITFPATESEPVSSATVTFDEPMPDNDYIIVFHPQGGNYEKRIMPSSISKTANGFTAECWNINQQTNVNASSFSYTAFKLYTDNEYNGLLNNQRYSTDEIDTGKTWIDGKKIYRKVIQTTTPSTNHVAASIASVPYVDTLISLSGMTLPSSTLQQNNINFYWGSDIYIETYYDAANKRISQKVSTYLSMNEFIIIEYTKTTDA